MACIVYDSPIGPLYLQEDGRGISALRLLRGEETGVFQHPSLLLDQAAQWLDDYFIGKARPFDLPMAPQGTAFQRCVWAALHEIPYGEIRSYSQIAQAIGRPSAVRAVGRACGANPLLIAVPCHRVVAADGRLTGFAAGMEAKKRLLSAEGWHIGDDRVISRKAE